MRVVSVSEQACASRGRLGCWVNVYESEREPIKTVCETGASKNHPQVYWTRLLALQSALSLCGHDESVIYTDSAQFLRAYRMNWDRARDARSNPELTKHGEPFAAHSAFLLHLIEQARAMSDTLSVHPLAEAPVALHDDAQARLRLLVQHYLRAIRTDMHKVRLTPEEAQRLLPP